MKPLLVAALLVGSSSVALAQVPVFEAPQAPAAGGVMFPATTKIAFVDPDRVLAATAEGKRLFAGIQAFRQKKSVELGAKNRELEALQTRRQQSAGVLAASALVTLDKDISRLGVEVERATQDAEAEYNERVGQVQLEFRKKLQPILIEVLKQREVHALLTPAAGLGWVDPAIDVTDIVAARLDQAYPEAAPAPRTR